MALGIGFCWKLCMDDRSAVVMPSRKRCLPRISMAIALGVLAGCGSSASSVDKNAPREVTKASLPVADESEREIFNQAQLHFSRGLYSASRERFQTLRSSYPDGPFSEYALLKIADTHFFSGAFGDAGGAYEEFITTYPGAASAPYALFQHGRSLMLSIRGVGRDTAPVERAVELFDQLLTKYPSSPFVEQAASFRDQALNTLAQQDELIGEFYLKQEQNAAVRYRNQRRQERLDAQRMGTGGK
jgi:outer membrane assembly lipoprotein YfiO